MVDTAAWIIIVLSYLVGTIPSGIVVSRVMGISDPRTIGSGNIGATNMLRTGSGKGALATLIGDMLKGAVPTLAGLYSINLEITSWSFLPYFAMLFAILGHCFPVWLRFRGGKGVATYIGGLAALPVAGFLLVGIVTWLVVAGVMRYSSLASLMSVLSVAVYGYWWQGWEAGVILFIMAAVIVLRHHANITRLIKGEESRIELKG